MISLLIARKAVGLLLDKGVDDLQKLRSCRKILD